MRLKDNIAVSHNGLIFNPATGDSFTVNPTGRFIMDCIRENKTAPEICAALASEFDVDAEAAERDLLEFSNLLQFYELVIAGENEG